MLRGDARILGGYPDAAEAPHERRRRTIAWWAIAAGGLWLANGALLVTPVAAIFVLAAAWRAEGVRVALSRAVPGLIWLASFAPHYRISLRHTA